MTRRSVLYTSLSTLRLGYTAIIIYPKPNFPQHVAGQVSVKTKDFSRCYISRSCVLKVDKSLFVKAFDFRNGAVATLQTEWKGRCAQDISSSRVPKLQIDLLEHMLQLKAETCERTTIAPLSSNKVLEIHPRTIILFESVVPYH